MYNLGFNETAEKQKWLCQRYAKTARRFLRLSVNRVGLFKSLTWLIHRDMNNNVSMWSAWEFLITSLKCYKHYIKNITRGVKVV